MSLRSLLQLPLVTLICLLISVVSQAAPESRVDRETLLNKARIELKREFIGVDEIIDSLCDQISSWYLFPETRWGVTKIFLPGPTSTGKTTLAHALMEKLELRSSYYYRDLRNYASDSDSRVLRSQIELDSAAVDGTQLVQYEGFRLKRSSVKKDLVFFFDELQMARSIDPMGNSIPRPAVEGMWEFFGFNRLTVPNPNRFLLSSFSTEYISEEIFPDQMAFQNLAHSEKVKLVERIQSQILKEPVEWDIDLSKTLVFIAGNIDDAFPINPYESLTPDGVDRLHKKTKAVTSEHVKQALYRMFRTEQVGRLGSKWVIFPTFSRKTYEHYIRIRVEQIRTVVREKLNFELEVAGEVYQRIFKEGVQPALGFRPLQDTIDRFIKDPISHIYSRIQKQYKDATNIQVIGSCVGSKCKKLQWRITQDGKVLEVLETSTPNEVSTRQSLPPIKERQRIAAHLAAVAAATVLLKGEPPRYMAYDSNQRSGAAFDFADTKSSLMSDQEIYSEVVINLAAVALERRLFGGDSKYTYPYLLAANHAANELVRTGRALPGISNTLVVPEVSNEVSTISMLEKVLAKAKLEADRLITQAGPMIQELISLLLKKAVVDQKSLIKISEKHIAKDTAAQADSICSGPFNTFMKTGEIPEINSGKLGF